MTLAPKRPGLNDGDKARYDHQRSWLAVLVLGSLVITLTNIVSSGGWPPAIVLAVLMLIHGWIAYKNESISPDTKGDGFYYLGLLFTFASLVPALIAFGGALEDAGNGGTADLINIMLPLIGNFGIALVTTIVGLGGRVLFTMTQDSPGDIAPLEDKIKKMTNTIAEGLQHWEILVIQLEYSADHLQRMKEKIASSVEKADSTAAVLAEHIHDFGDAVKSGSSSVAGLKESTTSTEEVLHGFGSALKDTAKMLRSVEGATKEAKAELSKAQDGAVREMEGVAAQVLALADKAIQVRIEFEKMTSAFADGTEAATRSLSAIESSARKAAALEEGLGKTGAAVSTLASNVVEAGVRMADATSGIRDVGGHATAASEGLEGMKDAAVLAQSELATVSRAASKLHDRLAGPGGEVAERMSAAATQADRAAADLNRITDQIDETQRGLYDIMRQSKAVVDKLAEQAGIRRRFSFFARLFKRQR